MTKARIRAMVAAGGGAAAIGGAPAIGQCTSTWDTAIGNPGIAGGYAAPVRLWNGRIYAGGSFTSVAGSAANQYLASWDPVAHTWAAVGGGLGAGFTNAFLTSMVTFNPGAGERLIVGGFYDNAGGVSGTASLAMFSGTSWEAMGTTWTGNTRGAIDAMAVWNGLLYVGGQIVNQPGMIAGQPWAGMATWDGTTWTPRISTLGGASAYIGALVVFDDGSGEALYASGRFTTVNNVAGTSLIARWNGTAWSSVGGGLTPTSPNFGIEGLAPFNDGSGLALYAVGFAFTPPGQPTCNVAKWNGHTWASVGPVLGTGRLTSIAAFDDGTGSTLYIGGNAMPQFNYIARLQQGSWVTVDGGITGPGIPPDTFPSVFGLSAIGDRLYVAGDFTQVNSTGANGLAVRTSCGAGTCYANCDGSTAAPVLNVADFTCFFQKFATGNSYANCDGSTGVPILNVQDFTCFLQKFAQGCP